MNCITSFLKCPKDLTSMPHRLPIIHFYVGASSLFCLKFYILYTTSSTLCLRRCCSWALYQQNVHYCLYAVRHCFVHKPLFLTPATYETLLHNFNMIICHSFIKSIIRQKTGDVVVLNWLQRERMCSVLDHELVCHHISLTLFHWQRQSALSRSLYGVWPSEWKNDWCSFRFNGKK